MDDGVLGLGLGIYFGVAILLWSYLRDQSGELLAAFLALLWPLTLAFGIMVVLGERKDEDD